MSPPKPAPVPTPETRPFFDGTRRGELLIQRCADCGHHFFYPRSSCPSCGSTSVAWVTASGRARLHTYVINHRPAPGFEDEAPYAIAIVELAEGPRMMTNIVGIDATPEALVLDMDLVVDFDERGDEVVPIFRPAAEPS
jgi:uncharacterized OB-fold protein